MGEPKEDFYAELRPITLNAVPEALAVSRFNLEDLAQCGEMPPAAMARFRDWLQTVCSGAKPILLAFNVGFDWSFVNWYFHRFLGENRFGFAAADIKSYYMGLTGCRWEETKSSHLPRRLRPATEGDHNVLTDARAQAEMFEKMRAARR